MRVEVFERRIFIVAPNFHGATLLSKLLHAHSNIVSLGDTYPSRVYDQVCGCGSFVSKCSFWLNVIESVPTDRHAREQMLLSCYPFIIGGADKYIYNSFPSYFVKWLLKKKNINLFKEDYGKFLNAVYRNHASKNPRMFIDGVKSISRIKALNISGVQIDGVIHITRSPCDFVQASIKQGVSLVEAALMYRFYHGAAKLLQGQFPYIRITYEDLVKSTDLTLYRLFNFINVPVLGIDELKENFNKKWHFMGNSTLQKFDGTMRYSTYEIEGREELKIRLLAGKQLL